MPDSKFDWEFVSIMIGIVLFVAAVVFFNGVG